MEYPILFNIKRASKNFVKKLNSEITAQSKELDVEPGILRLNYRCGANAYHHAMLENHKELAMVWYYFDGGGPSIHFVNFDGDKYIDNTLGIMTKRTEYFLIRHIPTTEMDKYGPSAILQDTKRHYENRATLVEKLFGNITR